MERGGVEGGRGERGILDLGGREGGGVEGGEGREGGGVGAVSCAEPHAPSSVL